MEVLKRKIEASARARIIVSMPQKMYDRLRKEAYERHVSMASIVRESLSDHFRRKSKDE